VVEADPKEVVLKVAEVVIKGWRLCSTCGMCCGDVLCATRP